MRKSEPFPALLRAFFYEWLAEQRNASIHTVRSYRDTWRLFLRFVAERKGGRVAQISLADLTASEVSAFLSHAEHERQGTIGTRNCRLAAIRGFFNFVAGKEPTLIAQCAEILTVPVKRAPVPVPCYLEPMEVEAILAQPDRSTLEGVRDHALLSFLYNSGARIQEALDLCPEAIRFEAPSCVRFGKGRRERICPLWPETVMLLRKLLERQPRAPNEPMFVNRYGEPLGASGVRFKLVAYVAAAAGTMPTPRSKHVTPHSFRHATPLCPLRGVLSTMRRLRCPGSGVRERPTVARAVFRGGRPTGRDRPKAACPLPGRRNGKADTPPTRGAFPLYTSHYSTQRVAVAHSATPAYVTDRRLALLAQSDGPFPHSAVMDGGGKCLLAKQLGEHMWKHSKTGPVATTGALALLACISGPAEAAVQITGQVQAGGGAVVNSTVTLWSATAGDPKQLALVRSGADGRFELASDQTPGGDTSLYLVAKGGTPAASAPGGDKPGDRLADRARQPAASHGDRQ